MKDQYNIVPAGARAGPIISRRGAAFRRIADTNVIIAGHATHPDAAVPDRPYDPLARLLRAQECMDGMSGWDEEYDLVIIGSGAGSIPAALVARTAGYSVLILEKTDKVGGSTAMSGGVVWTPNNPVMLREGARDSATEPLEYLNACAGEETPGSTAARREAFIEQGPRLVAFLESQGYDWRYADGYPDYHEGEFPGASRRGRALEAGIFNLKRLGAWADKLRYSPAAPPVLFHETPPLALRRLSLKTAILMFRVFVRLVRNRLGASLVGLGAALYAQMLEIALAKGVNFSLQTSLKEFVRAGDMIEGIVAARADREIRIRAGRAVLIDAGGFARNLAMRQKFQRAPQSDQWTVANPADTGEVLGLLMGLGAGTSLLDQAWWTPTTIHPDGFTTFIVAELQRAGAIMVDAGGQRYVNEATSYVAIGNAMYEREKDARAVPSWLIADHRYVSRYPLLNQPAGRIPESWISSGFVKKAGSIVELAQACGIDPAGLTAAIARFNQFARDGRDLDFGRGNSAYNLVFADPAVRPNPSLGPLDTPPYYGIRVFPGDVGTNGGVVTDEFARVLDDAGKPIAKLYATGNTTASVMGRSYPGAGASIAPAMVFGFIAARHIFARELAPGPGGAG
ncbi:MAG: FAD-binding protein [Gammaproteobacteria bacterium]|nr:FAD-binding protein [Gammaproteobacteria bacterium]